MWSESGPLPRDGEKIDAELRTVLENAGEESPYILEVILLAALM